jgi:hypothetical protein
VLHTGLLVDTVGLTAVVGQLVVNELDDVISDGSQEDVGETDFLDDLLFVAVGKDRNGGSEHRFYNRRHHV